jgi:hypothetical protein
MNQIRPGYGSNSSPAIRCALIYTASPLNAIMPSGNDILVMRGDAVHAGGCTMRLGHQGSDSIYSNYAFHRLPLWISHPGCSPIALFVPAFGVGWLDSVQIKSTLTLMPVSNLCGFRIFMHMATAQPHYCS